jgi:hypothetical protein
MESRVTIERLLSRTSSIAIARDAAPIRHVPSLFVRRVQRLELELDPA